LALRLPLLPLESFPQRSPPSAVVACERVLVCDSEAAAGGVFPGMRLADARALLPELVALACDESQTARRLAALACWAGNFTSEVCLAGSDVLLLEVAGSLRLFGGVDALLERVLSGMDEQGHAVVAALAPTPLAARWLSAGAAPGAPAVRCSNVGEMRAALAGLPLAALNLDPAVAGRLAGFGARWLGDVLPLPRSGLARRLGRPFTTDLARALGELPDPQLRYAFPETFRERMDLPAPCEEIGYLLFAVQRLISQLCGWLSARLIGVSEYSFLLIHDEECMTRVVIALGSVTRDPERLFRVLRERLERLVREGGLVPVTALVLQALSVETMAGRAVSLFEEDAAATTVPLLIEHLQARLGETQVRTLALLGEHRPECASREVAPGKAEREGNAVPAFGPRPAWLLPQPQPLAERDGRPQRGGPLTLVAGPERIESGWWDAGEPGAAGDVRRDYFVALSQHQECLWIFRCEAGWFLHGIYG